MIKVIQKSDLINLDDLMQIQQGSLDAVVIKNYFPNYAAQKYYNIITESKIILDSLDANFYQTSKQSRQGFKKYWDNAKKINETIEMLDEMAGQTFLSYLQDDLSQKLDCEIDGLNLDGYGCLSKIALHMWRNTRLPLHHDRIDEEAADSQKAKMLSAQFSCNIYLNDDFDGGELIVYENSTSHHLIQEYLADKMTISDLNLGRRAVITPKLGDAIIISSMRAHEVKKIIGQRAAFSFFLGTFLNDSTLRMWA